MINPTLQLTDWALAHLSALVALPSFSKEEGQTAHYLYQVLQKEQLTTFRYLNNVWAYYPHFDPHKPCIILNSHHDTVRPNAQYTFNPFEPFIDQGKLYGLGSNDAGASLVALMAAFCHLRSQSMPYNLIFVASAEEEISGKNGIAALLESAAFTDSLQGASILGAIVGEPTGMRMAVAERGLMVVDVEVAGIAAHAANANGVNAIYKAYEVINWLQQYEFAKTSALLGPVKMTVTSIETPNKAHNVVPDICKLVVDIRLNEYYTHEEVLATISNNCQATFRPRSMRLRSSLIALDHPVVKAGLALDLPYFGSATLSDKALMPFPALKCGPGLSERSHTADEFIYLDEITQGIQIYIALLTKIKL